MTSKNKLNGSELNLSRRSFMSGAVGLATLGMAAATLALSPTIRRSILNSASLWNDGVQGALFSPKRLAPIYHTQQITVPFPSNSFYPEAYSPDIDPATWQLKVGGHITRKAPITLSELRQMQQQSQITRLICIEGWSAIGEWSGVPLKHLLSIIGADLNAPYLRFDCEDGYYTSIDMASALHPQTILALDFLNQPLPRSFGAPLRLRIPTKLGFKNAKFINKLSVHYDFQGGYWEDKGYNWFAGL